MLIPFIAQVSELQHEAAGLHSGAEITETASIATTNEALIDSMFSS